VCIPYPLQEWLGPKFVASKPIRRKCIVFVVTKRLCSDRWLASVRGEIAGQEPLDPTIATTTTIMNERYQLAGLEEAAPAPVMGLFGCPRRQ
jgi:hypothetical protein